MSDAAILDAPLLDQGGAATALRDFLHDGPLVVVFLRHFG